MRSPRANTLAALVAALAIALGGCPSSRSTAVTITTARSVVQANSTLQLRASVSNNANQAVIWTLADPAGPGSITETGLYAAPVSVDETVEVSVVATSVADPGASGTVPLTVFAAPAIGVRQVGGRGEFYTVRDGARFIPRGNDFMRFSEEMTRAADGATGYGRSTFNATLYDPLTAEQALAKMEAYGYNVLRTFLDILQRGDLGSESGPGLSRDYIANLADFLGRAWAHHIYIMPVFEDLPYTGGYRDFLPVDVPW